MRIFKNMARVTVEDCIEKVKNRFELILMASKRAKDLERGAQPSVPRDNDKSTIIALREIAEETISLEGLNKLAKRSLVETDDENPFINANPDSERDLLSDEIGSLEDEEDDDDDLDEEDIAALDDLDAALDESEEIEIEE